MGSGSFGGGSGSFGGGSGGGAGGRGATTDSAHDRILKLAKLTESFNANPEIAKVSAAIYALLQQRTRSAFLRVMLSDAMVVSAYRALLSLDADLKQGATLGTAASKLGGSAGAALADLADAICQRGLTADTDERIEEIVRRAVAAVLLRTVSNKHELYYETPVESLRTKFSADPLQNTADIFLGTLIGEAVRRDLLNLNGDSRAVIAEASHQIAISWVDKFKEKGANFRDMMQTIGENYSAYSGGEHE